VKMNTIREWREIAIPQKTQVARLENSDKGLRRQSLCGTMDLPQADWLPERGSL
jgi:hypothetical protein